MAFILFIIFQQIKKLFTLSVNSIFRNKKMAKKIKVKNSLFNIHSAQELVDRLKKELNYPFILAYASKLGGDHNITIMLAVSTTTKENWESGIFENSQYRRFSIFNDGTVENFTASGMTKVRKFTAKSIDDLINRLNK